MFITIENLQIFSHFPSHVKRALPFDFALEKDR